jgi:ABC-type multidrug transport system fused ATPase/permease subunit
LLSQTLNRGTVLSSAVRPIADLLAVLLVGVIAFNAIVIGASLAATFAFVAILVRLQPTVQSLAHQMTMLSQLQVSYDAVEGIARELGSHREVDVENAAPISDIGPEIVIEGVSFAYEAAAQPALRDVTLRIPRGETVAIMGASGAGKTTIISLLLRLLDPGQGEIRVGDGAPLSSVRRSDWLALTGVAGQDMELIEGTLIDSIAIAAPGVTRERAMDALDLAGAGEFVRTLPEGLDTQLGPRGRYLSGGQRQRILLAAALARNPQILLLDEATNAIDARAEAEVLRNIRKARPDLTIVVIAHRGAAVTTAAHAVVLREGVVVDAGRPEVLLEKIDSPLAGLLGLAERGRTAGS